MTTYSNDHTSRIRVAKCNRRDAVTLANIAAGRPAGRSRAVPASRYTTRAAARDARAETPGDDLSSIAAFVSGIAAADRVRRSSGDAQGRPERDDALDGLIFTSKTLRGGWVALEEIDDGIWSLYYGPVLLARFNERRVCGVARLHGKWLWSVARHRIEWDRGAARLRRADAGYRYGRRDRARPRRSWTVWRPWHRSKGTLRTRGVTRYGDSPRGRLSRLLDVNCDRWGAVVQT